MKELMDPFEWLPGYGENAVILRTGPDLRLTVTVAYDSPEDRYQTRCRDIVFETVTEFTKRAFPDVLGDDRETTRIQRERARRKRPAKESTWRGYSLSVDEDSVRAEEWTVHFKGTRTVNAYFWLFVEENVELEIYASGFTVGEERAWTESGRRPLLTDETWPSRQKPTGISRARRKPPPMKPLMDPYDWLPADGESRVIVRMGQVLDLIVTVVYDSPDGSSLERCRDIVFDGVREFTQRPFPTLALDGREPTRAGLTQPTRRRFWHRHTWRLGTLGVDEGSTRAKAWTGRYGNRRRSINRYFLHFLSANIEIETFAESFSVGEERVWDGPSS